MKPIPEPFARGGALMQRFEPIWSLCGGWAVDAWLGQQTRDHGDVDVATFRDDESRVFECGRTTNSISSRCLLSSAMISVSGSARRCPSLMELTRGFVDSDPDTVPLAKAASHRSPLVSPGRP